MSVGGSGLSSGGGSLDIGALMELLTSKDGAKARIQEFQAAKQAFEKAQEDLKLGHAARDILDSVESIKETAKTKIASDRIAFQKEMEAAKKAHQDWLDSTKADIQAKLADAKDKADHAEKLDGERRALYEEAKRIKDQADTALIVAKRDIANAERHANQLAAKAEAALQEYTSTKSRYDAAIKAIKAAAASI
jgi:hypothetical protein